ncbi:MAG: multicopper oxidase domain-containing protein [Hyphomicrobiales bacterium]|nr:multicopper oxidase domain-containing protein [Hyphomicrobiales bacterium]
MPEPSMRFMMLKDAQIAFNGTDGQYDFSAKISSTLCATPNSFPNGDVMSFWPNGECESRDANNAYNGMRWIFTVNGVQNPLIEFARKPAAGEVWRIANSSPTVSYHLSILPLAQAQKAIGPNPPGLCRKYFDVLSKDGAAVPNDTTAPTERTEKEIVLMPGARIEIFVSDLHDFDWALVQEGVSTGGDSWPRTILATIHPEDAKAPPDAFDCAKIAPQQASAASAVANVSGPKLATAVAPARKSTVKSVPSKTRIDRIAACDPLAGRERLVQFVKNNAYGDATDGWKAKDLFGVLAGVRNAGDSQTARYFRRSSASQSLADMANVARDVIDPLMTKRFTQGAPDNFVPAFGNFPEFGNICVTPDPDAGFVETWVIENWTNEIHNFHLHQTRFFVAAGPTDNSREWLGNPAYFDFPCRGWSYKDDADAIRCANENGGFSDAANGFVDIHIKDFFNAHASTGNGNSALSAAAHDSVPIPRGACIDTPPGLPTVDCATGPGCDGTVGNPYCHPARITLRVPFNRSEQIGDFVYHCHILEHEDRGMMGIVHVVGRADTKKASVFDEPLGLLAALLRKSDPLAGAPICTAAPR